MGVRKSAELPSGSLFGTLGLGSSELRVGNLRLPRFGDAQPVTWKGPGLAMEGDTAGGPKPTLEAPTPATTCNCMGDSSHRTVRLGGPQIPGPQEKA